ncbi:MAG: zinc ribbon domain-containing protein, partial [Deltaproteobacteria bacterium]
MPTCPACAEQISSDVETCPHCGVSIHDFAAGRGAAGGGKKSSSTMIILIVVAGAFFVMLACGGVL